MFPQDAFSRDQSKPSWARGRARRAASVAKYTTLPNPQVMHKKVKSREAESGRGHQNRRAPTQRAQAAAATVFFKAKRPSTRSKVTSRSPRFLAIATPHAIREPVRKPKGIPFAPTRSTP